MVNAEFTPILKGLSYKGEILMKNRNRGRVWAVFIWASSSPDCVGWDGRRSATTSLPLGLTPPASLHQTEPRRSDNVEQISKDAIRQHRCYAHIHNMWPSFNGELQNCWLLFFRIFPEWLQRDISSAYLLVFACHIVTYCVVYNSIKFFIFSLKLKTFEA